MREFSRVRCADCGSFIVDRRGTILGFDLALEELTGWPAVQVVGRHKDLARSMRAEEEGRTSRIVCAPFYDGEIGLSGQQGNLSLTLNCRDGRTLDVEAAATRLGGPGERMLVQVLRVMAGLRECVPGSVL